MICSLPLGEGYDCKDAGGTKPRMAEGTTPWMEEVEQRRTIPWMELVESRRERRPSSYRGWGDFIYPRPLAPSLREGE